MNTIRQFFRELDMFPAPVSLRIREGPEMTNGFFGLVSVLLALLFAFVFFNSFIKTVNKQNIDYSVADESLPKEGTEFETDQIMYAVQILNLNYSTAAKIFILKVINNNQNFSTGLVMQQCTASHWQMLGQDYEEQFSENQLENFFCPPKGLKFKNTASHSDFIAYQIIIDICFEDDSPQCLSNHEAFDAFDDFTDQQYFVQVRVVMIDTGFTPKNLNATKKLIDRRIQYTFSQIRTVWVNVDYSMYRVETDESIMPWEDIHIEEGFYVSYTKKEEFENNNYFYYSIIFFRVRLYQKTFQRVFGKFDDMLSYAGGLFAIIIGFLSFFLISFNEYRYELLVGQRAFSYDEKGNKVRENDFGFLFYVQYSLFDWLNVLFCLDLQWGRCKRVDQTREELNKQIDTTLLMRRLQHIERCVFSTVGEDYKMGMYMHRSEHLEEIKLNRMYLEYYEWIIKGAESLTVEDIETAEHIFSSPNQLNANSLMDFAMKSSSRGLLSTVMDKFPELQEEALSIQLTEEQLEVEKDLASAFRSMNSKVKEKLEKKIPLKILYRFKTYDKPKMPPLIHSGMDLDESPQ